MATTEEMVLSVARLIGAPLREEYTRMESPPVKNWYTFRLSIETVARSNDAMSKALETPWADIYFNMVSEEVSKKENADFNDPAVMYLGLIVCRTILMDYLQQKDWFAEILGLKVKRGFRQMMRDHPVVLHELFTGALEHILAVTPENDAVYGARLSEIRTRNLSVTYSEADLVEPKLLWNTHVHGRAAIRRLDLLKDARENVDANGTVGTVPIRELLGVTASREVTEKKLGVVQARLDMRHNFELFNQKLTPFDKPELSREYGKYDGTKYGPLLKKATDEALENGNIPVYSMANPGVSNESWFRMLTFLVDSRMTTTGAKFRLQFTRTNAQLVHQAEAAVTFLAELHGYKKHNPRKRLVWGNRIMDWEEIDRCKKTLNSFVGVDVVGHEIDEQYNRKSNDDLNNVYFYVFTKVADINEFLPNPWTMVAHAGEFDTRCNLESAFLVCNQIQHGIGKTSSFVKLLILTHQIPLQITPKSNQVLVRDICEEEYPVKEYLELGMNLKAGTDDEYILDDGKAPLEDNLLFLFAEVPMRKAEQFQLKANMLMAVNLDREATAPFQQMLAIRMEILAQFVMHVIPI